MTDNSNWSAGEYSQTQSPSSPSSPEANLPKTQNQTRRTHIFLETKRYLKVINECIVHLDLVSKLPALMDSFENLPEDLREDLKSELQKHQLLTQLVEQGGEDQAEVELAFRGSVKNILRILLGHPGACTDLKTLDTTADLQDILQNMKELKGYFHEWMLTSPEEEEQSKCSLQTMTQKHLVKLEQVASLEENLANLMKDWDVEVLKKNEIIRQLTTSLQELEKSTEEYLTNMQQDAQNQSLSDRNASESRCIGLQEEIVQLKQQLANLRVKNNDHINVLRKKRCKLEMEIENWIQKYDSDMGERQNTLMELYRVYNEEKDELEDLEERFALMDVEYTQIVEERRLIREQKEEEERLLVLHTKAVIVLQAFWRGHLVRQAIKKLKKSKKKKKGKKGKKGR